MATAFAGRDALGTYECGTGADGIRTGFEVNPQAALFSGNMPGIVIERISGRCAAGIATLEATGENSLRFAAPGDTFGASVTVASGEHIVAVSGDGVNWCRLYREDADPLGGTLSMRLVTARDGTALSNAEREAGWERYLQFMLYNHSAAAVSDVAAYIVPLAASVESDAGQLGASGAGSIETTEDLDALEWPAAGFARIETSGGTLREIVYYEERTDTELIVPTDGRGMLGTTPAAGSATDVIYPVPMCAVGVETPDSDGKIQALADPEDVPSGVDFFTGLEAADGAEAGTVAAGHNHGFWVRVQVPPGALGGRVKIINVAVQFRAGGTLYWDTISGERLIRETPGTSHAVWIGEDGPPDFSAAPDAISNLPIAIGVTPPVSGEKRITVCVRQANEAVLLGLNTEYSALVIDSDGDEVTREIRTPENISLQNLHGGYVSLVADYLPDADPADTWLIFVRDDGTDPDTGSDTPVEVSMGVLQGLGPYITTSRDLGPYDWGTELRAIVQAKRSIDDEVSADSAVASLTVATRAPDRVHGLGMFLKDQFSIGGAGPDDFELETVIDLGDDVVIVQKPGETSLRVGAEVILRVVLSTNGDGRIYLGEAWDLVNDTVSGAGSADPVEVVSADELYLCHSGDRVVKIDVSAQEIICDEFHIWNAVEDVPVDEAFYQADDFTAFQVWDPHAGRWRNWLQVEAGRLVFGYPVTQRLT